MEPAFSLAARTLPGLETLLEEELLAAGATDTSIGRRVVRFSGDRRVLYRANLCCRLAIRILRLIATFQAESEKAYYDQVQQIDWRLHLADGATLAVDPIVRSSFTTHSLYLAQLTKDAIVDQIRAATGRRPLVDRSAPDVRISVHLVENEARVYLDSSGESLHRRGYRLAGGEAPLNEVLAAGLLRLSEWKPPLPLVDFFCGSGTLLIEAALLARNRAPGLIGRSFGFQRWIDYDPVVFGEELVAARAREVAAPKALLLGGDIQPEAIRQARANARRAGVAEDIRFKAVNFEELVPPPPPGMVLTNPPYDERMPVARVADFYRRIGHLWKRRYDGYTAWLFTGALEGAKHLGLRASRRIPLRNGPIECRLLRYEIVGTQPSAAASPPPNRADKWERITAEFQRRLEKNFRHIGRWARRQGITCFRVYDHDIPKVPLVIDWYEGRLHIAEYARSTDESMAEHAVWLEGMARTAGGTLGVRPAMVFLKQRRRQGASDRYQHAGDPANTFIVHEGGHSFFVNLADYLDTGLFLDHRLTRQLVANEAKGQRFLNLFGYTGAFTVYAAAGGARDTTTIDWSNTYLEWAEKNFRQNGIRGAAHRLVRADAREFVANLPPRPGGHFDVVVVDPPTFSNKKGIPLDWDIERDHATLLLELLRHVPVGGRVYFSTNFRRFRLREDELQERAAIRNITRKTIPPDFRDQRIHQTFLLTRT